MFCQKQWDPGERTCEDIITFDPDRDKDAINRMKLPSNIDATSKEMLTEIVQVYWDNFAADGIKRTRFTRAAHDPSFRYYAT